MSFENPDINQVENPEHSKERSRAEGDLNFEIQRILIKRSHYNKETKLGTHALQWIGQFSESFSPVFEELMMERPNIVQEWKDMTEDEKEKIAVDLENRLPAFDEAASTVTVEEEPGDSNGLDMDPFERAA